MLTQGAKEMIRLKSLLSGNFADGMWQGIVWQQESVFWGCYRLEL
jgi:hypothetical protein